MLNWQSILGFTAITIGEKMTKFSLEQLTEYLGEPSKVEGKQVHWQCPYCSAEGGDNSKDNLTYNIDEKLISCFANSAHSPQLYRDIFSNPTKKKTVFSKTSGVNPKPENPLPDKAKLTESLKYACKCRDDLLNNQAYLNNIEQKRGINKTTIESSYIGFDFLKNRWVFPTVPYTTDKNNYISGFEYRPFDLNKNGICRDKGSQTCMCMVNPYTPNVSCLVILEGYIDAYTFKQHLYEQGQLLNYHIVTPSNGVSTIVNNMKSIEEHLCNYSKIYAFLDSDKAGIENMQKLKELYPFIETKIMTCGCKDFNEHYLKCIKKINLGE